MSTYKKFLDYLRFLGHPAVENLQNGLSKNEIDEKLEGVLKSYHPIYDVFTVANGMQVENKPIGALLLFDYGIPLTLDEALKLYRINLRDELWSATLFPLFDSGGSDFLLIQLDEESVDYKRIFLFSPAQAFETQYMIIYDSLEAMFRSIIECYDKNIYYIQDGFLEVDNDRLFPTCRKLNPNSDYWDEKYT